MPNQFLFALFFTFFYDNVMAISCIAEIAGYVSVCRHMKGIVFCSQLSLTVEEIPNREKEMQFSEF